MFQPQGEIQENRFDIFILLIFFGFGGWLGAGFKLSQQNLEFKFRLSLATSLTLTVVWHWLLCVVAGLLCHLCVFHVYIYTAGLTTYEYIRQYQAEGNTGRGNKVGPGAEGDNVQG